MKYLILLGFTSCLIFASTVEVIRDKVKIEINGAKKLALKGDKIILKNGDTVCIVEGKGKLIIDNQIQISSRSRNKCYKNFNDGGSQSLASTVESYLSSDEDSVSGMTRGIKKH